MTQMYPFAERVELTSPLTKYSAQGPPPHGAALSFPISVGRVSFMETAKERQFDLPEWRVLVPPGKSELGFPMDRIASPVGSLRCIKAFRRSVTLL